MVVLKRMFSCALVFWRTRFSKVWHQDFLPRSGHICFTDRNRERQDDGGSVQDMDAKTDRLNQTVWCFPMSCSHRENNAKSEFKTITLLSPRKLGFHCSFHCTLLPAVIYNNILKLNICIILYNLHNIPSLTIWWSFHIISLYLKMKKVSHTDVGWFA